MIATLQKLTDRLIGLSALIGTAGLLFVVGVIIVDVVGRNFGRPLYGSQDLITMTMVLIVFGGMALCDRVGGHIIVDIFESMFPASVNRAIDIASALLGAAIFVMIGYTIFSSAQLSQMLNLSTNLLRLPLFWFQYALCAFAIIGSAGMLLRAITLLIGQAPEAHRQKEMP